MKLFKFAVALLGLSVISSTWSQTSNADSPLGINLTGINYWSTQWTLVDVMKQASTGSGQLWATSNADTYEFNTGHQALLDLDSQGWPKHLPDRSSTDFHYATTIIYQDNEHHPAGDFVVLYDGEGTLHYSGTNLVVKKSPGRDVITVSADSFLHLQIQQTDPNNTGNYLRNIRVIVPGGTCGDAFSFARQASDCAKTEQFVPFEENHQTQIFHPLFLQDMQKYRTVRFMQFFNTINSPIETWQQRPQYRYASWALALGSPIETALALVNRTQAEPWLNVPVRVNDAYVRDYARLVKETLDPHLNFYVEFGNELWNSAYPYILDGNYAEQKGRDRWPDANVSAYEYRLNYFALRSYQVCEIFKQTFAEQAHRVQCVMGGFTANPWVNEQTLSCPLVVNDGGQPCHSNMDALAIGPYFAGYFSDDRYLNILSRWVDDGNLDKLFEEMYRGVLRELTDDPNRPEWEQAPKAGALKQTADFVVENKKIADKYQLALVAYEGGQHLTYGGNLAGARETINNQLFLPANRDPRMGKAITDHLNDWQTAGGQTYVFFESTGRWGRYGAFPFKTHQLDNDNPKFVALQQYLDNTPCWWENCTRDTRSQRNQTSVKLQDSFEMEQQR